jgi:hypothetical protein
MSHTRTLQVEGQVEHEIAMALSSLHLRLHSLFFANAQIHRVREGHELIMLFERWTSTIEDRRCLISLPGS